MPAQRTVGGAAGGAGGTAGARPCWDQGGRAPCRGGGSQWGALRRRLGLAPPPPGGRCQRPAPPSGLPCLSCFPVPCPGWGAGLPAGGPVSRHRATPSPAHPSTESEIRPGTGLASPRPEEHPALTRHTWLCRNPSGSCFDWFALVGSLFLQGTISNNFPCHSGWLLLAELLRPL